jgi:hypothetical protein
MYNIYRMVMMKSSGSLLKSEGILAIY